MATITGSATGGNWSATTAWIGGVVPATGDDVLLTSASGNVTVDGTSGTPSTCRSLNCTTYVGTLGGVSGVLQVGDSAGGSLTFVSGMTYSGGPSTATINFISTTTGNTVTTGGKSMPNVTFNGVGGSWQFQDNYTGGNSSVLKLTAGTLDMNSKTVSLAGSFTASGSTVRTLTLGAAAISIAGGDTVNLAWDCSTSTNMTLTANTATITMTSAFSAATFNGGGLSTWHNLVITGGNAGGITIATANTFNNLTLTGGTSNGFGAKFSANQTVTGTFTVNGNSVANRYLCTSATFGTAVTITAATVSAQYADFQDITAAGAAAPWALSAITGGSGDCGGNSGITFNTPKNCYMKTAVSVNWSASNWFTTSGGSTTISPTVPLVQDTCIFDVNSVTAASKTITMDVVRTGSVNFTGVANTPAFASTTWALFGSLTLVSGMTHTGSGALTISGRGSFNFDGGGLTWPTSSTITVNILSGNTYTQQSNFTSNSTVTFTSGTWAGNGKNLTCTTLIVSSTASGLANVVCTALSAISAGGSLTTTGTIAGGSTLAVSGGTLSAGGAVTGFTTANLTSGSVTLTGGGTFSSTFTISAAAVTTGGTLSCTGYSHMGGTGTMSLGGNLTCSSTWSFLQGTFSANSFNVQATTLSISASTTRTLNMGSGTWTATSTGTVWNAATITGLTFNAQTSTIALTNTSVTTKAFVGSTLTYNNIAVSGAASNGILTFSGAFIANILTFAALSSIHWTSSTTTTISSLVCNGFASELVTFAATTSGTFATLSCANPVDVDFMSIKDNHASGNTPFYAGTNSTDVSGNLNWTFTARPVGGIYSDPIWFGMTF